MVEYFFFALSWRLFRLVFTQRVGLGCYALPLAGRKIKQHNIQINALNNYNNFYECKKILHF
jgi:hypothetical protein